MNFFEKTEMVIRTPWSCGLICHVLHRKVEGSDIAAVKNIFQFKSTKISSWKSELKKQGTLLLIASVRAVAVGEEEETRRERERSKASFEASILCGGAI